VVEVENGTVIVDLPVEQVAEINRFLVQSGFAVSQLRHWEGQLEEQFLALTGQVGLTRASVRTV
jgi:hypothetical protein